MAHILWVVRAIWSLAAGEHTFSEDAVTARDGFEALTDLMAGVTLLATPIAFCMWEYRAVRQLNASGINTGTTPGWAVGWWFVPFATLYKPYRVIETILISLGGPSLPKRLRIGGWWAAWIIGNILGNGEARLSGETAHILGIASGVLTVIAGLLCIRIVQEIQSQLDARRTVV